MKKFLISLTAFLALLSAPALASSNTNSDLFQVCNDAQSKTSSVCKDSAAQTTAGTNPVNHYIHVATDIVASLTGIAAIIMIIYSGFKFASGGGSTESIKSARSTLIAAVIGLALVALSWTIINFVINKLIP